ncbi:EpsG family protein [Acinetobacter indicus]
MIEYIVILFLSTILSFFYSISKNKLFKIICLFVLVLVLSILYYIRDFSIGTDTHAYVDYFELLKNIKYSEIFYYANAYNVEFFFFIISKLLLDVFGSIQMIFFVYAIILYTTLISSFRMLNLNLVLLVLSIFSFFPIFYYNFNILRQSIALSFIILSCVYLIRGQNNNFLLLIVIAGLFHSSALVCILFYFIYKYRDYIYNKIFYFIIFFMSSFYLFLKAISGYLDKYIVYIEVSDGKPFSFSIIFIFSLISIFSYIVRNKANLQWYKDVLKFFNIVLLFFISYNILLYVIGISNQGLNRIGFYFLWPIIFIVPILIRTQFKGNNRIVVNMLSLVLYVLASFYLLVNQSESIIPFQYG